MGRKKTTSAKKIYNLRSKAKTVQDVAMSNNEIEHASDVVMTDQQEAVENVEMCDGRDESDIESNAILQEDSERKNESEDIPDLSVKVKLNIEIAQMLHTMIAEQMQADEEKRGQKPEEIARVEEKSDSVS